MSTVLPFRKPDREPVHEPSPGREQPPLWREALGDELRAARTGRGERLTDVADRAGVSPQYLSEIERGRKDPSSEVLAAVTGALEVALPTLTHRAADHMTAVSGPVCRAA